jgi:quercetin dioxygenase-like cupin family protein
LQNTSRDSDVLRRFRTQFATVHRSHGSLALALLGVTVTIQLDAAGPAGRQRSATQAREARRAAAGSRGCGTPVSERKTESGCYTTAETSLGVLPSGSLFWHLYAYPSRAAAEAARGPKGTVTESFGKHWLFTIAEESWHPAAGEKVAIIGPLVVAIDKPYTARYMEAVFPPGSQPVGGPGHRHPGPEAWYVLSGSQCLETPNGVITASAGGTAMVPEGWPMAVSDAGLETRRTVLLVLHPSSEPYSSAIDDPRSPGPPHAHWKPRGLCP